MPPRLNLQPMKYETKTDREWLDRRVLALGLILALAGGCNRAASTSRSINGSSVSTTNPTTEPQATATTQSADDATADRLYGTWVANDVDAKIGSLKVKLTFHQDGPMKLVAWSDIPFVGEVRNKTCPYQVHGDIISSQAIRGGTSVHYHFDGDDLIIRYEAGKTIRFHRV